MAKDLISRMREARQTLVPVGGFKFVIRRPTELEMIELQGEARARGALRHVIGWEDVKESDVLENGNPDPLGFDADVCTEWLSDRLELLTAVTDAVFKSFSDHTEKRRAAEKN